MAFDPRKRRTRQHVIADLSVHYVEGFILEAGHTAQRLGSDYGYDLIMNTFDELGYAGPGPVYFQIKAAEALRGSGAAYWFDMDIRDYNLWVREEVPVVLVLYDATKRRAYWLAIQQFFRDDATRRPAKGARRVRVFVPKRWALHRSGVAKIREQKRLFVACKLGVAP